MLEVIATNVAEAVAAEQAGADRIELISDMSVGGLTPLPETTADVLQSVRIPVNVMVRPHSQSFVYNRADLDAMQQSIQALNEWRPNGLVLGALTSDGEVDEAGLQSLLDEIDEGIEVTFHKAFDELSDQSAGLEILKNYAKITRVLTSGGAAKAPEAMTQIRRLVEQSKNTRLTMLAGGGLTVETLTDFLRETAVSEVHFGSAARRHSSSDEMIDSERIQRIKQMMAAV